MKKHGCERWIKAEASFPVRRAIVQIEIFGGVDEDRIANALDEATVNGDLAGAESEISERISALFPRLSGCSLHFVRMSWERHAWEVGISHPSLEAVAEGCHCPRISVTDGIA